MVRTIFSTLAVTFALAGLAAPALADVAPSPCDGKKSGDSCMTDSGDDGTCESTKGALVCEPATTDDNNKSSGCTFGGGAPATGGLALVAAAAALSLSLRRRRR